MRDYQKREKAESEHFDQLADATGETWWGSTTPAGVERLRRRGRLLATALSAFTDPFVVELGCGTGAFSQYLLEQHPSLRLHGVDISVKAASVAAERLQIYPHAVFQQGSALALEYGDGSVDAVIGCSILHHLPMPEALTEAFRVLRPSGMLWFSEPNMMNPQILLEKNIRFIGKMLQNTEDETTFFRWSIGRQLVDTGFSHVAVRPFDFLHPIIPSRLVYVTTLIGLLLEKIPFAREFAGSLLIIAVK